MIRIKSKLRHKLYFSVAVIITTLLLTGVLAIVKMERILNNLEQIDADTLTQFTITEQLVNRVNELSDAHAPSAVNSPGHKDKTRALSESVNLALDELLTSPNLKRSHFDSVNALITLCRSMQDAIAEQGPSTEAANHAHADRVRAYARLIQDSANDVMRTSLNNSIQDRMAATRQFRWVLAGIAIVCLVIIDALLVVLIRASSSVLKPVHSLIEAGARIRENAPGHRIALHRQDEFDDIERIFNELADQIDTNEHKMVDTVHQVARALSHELNNAITIVDLQLSCIKRTPKPDEDRMAEHIEEIHRAMLRVSAVVATLSRVQRIVLTDYLSGVQMLDLQKSVTEDQPNDARTPP